MEFPTFIQMKSSNFNWESQGGLVQDWPSGKEIQQTGFNDEVILSENAHMSMAGKNAAEKNTLNLKQESLSPEETRQITELKQRDAEVRAHEAAHMAAGSGLVRGGAKYQYTNGPDGKQYITGGEVGIDASPEKDPQATIKKMQQVRQAALAPANPSSTDRAVAAQAAQQEAQARMTVAQETNKTEPFQDHTKEMIWGDDQSHRPGILVDKIV